MSEEIGKYLVSPSGENSLGCVHAGASRALAEGYSELEDLQDESQHLPEERTEKGQKSQAGLFSRLRRTLSFRSLPHRELLTRRTSPVKAVHINTAEVAGDNLIITPIKRMPNYRCVALPPGYVPTEVMEITEEENQLLPGLDPRSVNIDGVSLTRKRKENSQQNVANVPEDQSNERCMPSKVLRNNWVFPDFTDSLEQSTGE